MPGEYNPVIPGATVYANNPNNPFADKAGNELCSTATAR